MVTHQFWIAQRLFRAVRSTRHPIMVGAALCGLLVVSAVVRAQCDPSVAANFGGETTAVALLSSNALYVAHGRTLDLINGSTTNPSTFLHYLNQSGTRLLLPSPARRISRLGPGYTYVLLDDGDVLCISGSTATTTAVATIGLGTPAIADIQADGTRVYAVSGSSLLLYDLSSGAPVWQSTIGPIAPNYIMDRVVKVSGTSTVWVAIHLPGTSVYGVSAYDFSNPVAPTLVSTVLDSLAITDTAGIDALAINAGATSLFVGYRGRSGQSSVYTTWIRGVSIADPIHPTWNLGFDTGYTTHDISVTGTQLHIASDNYLQIWNAADPNALSEAGYYHIQGGTGNRVFAGSSSVLNGKSFVAAGAAGLIVVDTSTPSSNMPVLGTVAPLPWRPLLLRQMGTTTVVLDEGGVLRLFDYTLPEAQQARGVLSIGSATVPGVELCSTSCCKYACVRNANNSIAVIDITNNLAPAVTGTFLTAFGRTVLLMCTDQERLYMMDSTEVMHTLEINASGVPILRNSLQFVTQPTYSCLVAWSSGTQRGVAIGSNTQGVQSYNTTNAASTNFVGQFRPDLTYRVLAMCPGTSGRVYVGDSVGVPGSESHFLHTLDVSGGSGLYLIATRFDPGRSFDHLGFVSLSSHEFLFATDNALPGELNWLDATDPFNPVTVQHVALPWLSDLPAAVPGASTVRAACGKAGIVDLAMPDQWFPVPRSSLSSSSACRMETLTVSFDPTSISAGTGPVSYQWIGVDHIGPVHDGPTGHGSIVSGATTPTLYIQTVRQADSDTYYCLVTNACGTLGLGHVHLHICDADFNCDSHATVSDIFLFLAAWFGGSSSADMDLNGQVAVADIFQFLAKWFVGC